MTYAHITLDVGEAIKAYHVIWNDPDLWKNVIIHLGDFHCFMAFFGVVGRDLTPVWSMHNRILKMLLSGKHYNVK